MSLKLNKTERRRKFSKWISTSMLRSEGKLPFFPFPLEGEIELTNIMSNADRRARGFSQDPDLPDFQPEITRTDSSSNDTVDS